MIMDNEGVISSSVWAVSQVGYEVSLMVGQNQLDDWQKINKQGKGNTIFDGKLPSEKPFELMITKDLLIVFTKCDHFLKRNP